MLLSGEEIKKNIHSNIIIEPYSESQLNSNSYNLKLSNELEMYEADHLDMKKDNKTIKMTIPDHGLMLRPNKLYLGRTVEYTKTDNFVPMLEGRSSVGRLGLFVHVTAGFGDVGFAGYWTLEIHCVEPIIIYPNVEICQIYYHTIQGDYQKYNSGKYQNNTGIQPSLLYKEFEKDGETITPLTSDRRGGHVYEICGRKENAPEIPCITKARIEEIKKELEPFFKKERSDD